MERGSDRRQPPEVLHLRVEAVLGTGRWTSVDRGYTAAEGWVVTLADGDSAFVKGAVDDLTATWLRAEARVYASIALPCMPRVLHTLDGDRPALVLENLSAGTWPPPWPPTGVERVRSLLRDLAGVQTPAWLPRLVDLRDDLLGWERIAAEPGPFLSLGLCTADWLRTALPQLTAAARTADLTGDALVHADVRSDNLCLLPERTVLVDWNHACHGNPTFDLAAWLPSLRAEGGPPPEEHLPDAATWAALVAGYLAARAGLPAPAGTRFRVVQRTQLHAALPWAVRALDLPALDGPVATEHA